MPQKIRSREVPASQAPGCLIRYDDSPEITPPALFQGTQRIAASSKDEGTL